MISTTSSGSCRSSEGTRPRVRVLGWLAPFLPPEGPTCNNSRMKLISLDLATNFGFALHPVASASVGSVNIRPRTADELHATADESPEMRHVRLRNALNALARRFYGPYDDLVVAVEGSKGFSRGIASSGLSNELKGVVRLWCGDHGARYFAAVQPTTLKVFAVGYGGSKKWKVGKPEMLQAARERFGYTGSSHDEADALILREYILAHPEILRS